MPRLLLAILSAASLAATCGCSSLGGWTGSLNPLAPKFVKADAKQPAVEVACIWQPGEGRNGNGVPARGFSGQVFFFTARHAQPALVDGEMRIYLFADRGTPDERARPLHQYDFTPEAWSTHATQTSLGPGYAVFVPYPTSEPYQVRCQLRARFTPREGPVIWSEAVAMTLEGPPSPGSEPLSMAGRDPNAKPLPTVIDARITHQSGPVSALREEPPRRLRTDTFHLGEIRQTAYESPRREAAAATAEPALDALDTETLREMLKDVSRNGAASHPLEDLRGEAPSAVEHPLKSSRHRLTNPARGNMQAPTPAETERPTRLRLPGRPSTTRPPLTRRHPLDGESAEPPEDATPVRGPGRHPLSPAGAVGRENESPEFAAETPADGAW